MSTFTSIFKINGKPIIPPVITDELRKEIAEIRNLCKAKEEKLKLKKDLDNEAKKSNLMRSRSDSYTLSSPIFPVDQLPEAHSEQREKTEESFEQEGNETIESEVIEELHHDEKAQNKQITQDESVKKEEPPEVEKEELKTPAPSESYEFFQPQLKSQIQDLIKKQKEEYLDTVNVLKKRFLNEQQELLQKLQSSMQNLTSTPLTNVSMAQTEDEEFTEFQTCLQSINNIEEEPTLTDDQEQKDKAATLINAYARGYLVRRIEKTIYVQECIRNIRDTLQVILTLDQDRRKSDEIKDILLKTKLFQQLQSDLYRLHNIYFQLSTREQMKLIANDRERRITKLQKSKENQDRLNRSFQENSI